MPSSTTASHPPFAELCARSNFSFLRGASHPEQLVERAHALGLHALGLCDEHGIYGIVRAHVTATPLQLPLIVGTELHVHGSASSVLLLAQNHDGYANLCDLLTFAHAGGPHAPHHVSLEQLSSHNQGLFALLPLPVDSALTASLRDIFTPQRLRLAVHRHRLPDSRTNQRQALHLASSLDLRVIATSRPLFHEKRLKPLADVLTCIREHTTLDEAATRLLPNAEAYLASPQQMARTFADHPAWLYETVEVADQCTFRMDELTYQFPAETYCQSNETPDDALSRIVHDKLPWRYPAGPPTKVRQQIAKELALIAKLDVAPYFLSVLEIVEIARERNILCQGRGSAANSAVCFVLGITAVDPARSNLLFERFLSEQRAEPPDIDVDFEHERREEIIQEIYRRYGRDRAAMVSEVIRYRGKSALREVGKAFGLSLEQLALLSGLLLTGYEPIDSDDLSDERLREAGLDPNDPRIRQVLHLAKQIQRFPRHLSIHVGGFVLSSAPLRHVAPVQPASMPGRTIIPWDKDDMDALGFFKIDLLSLGIMSAIRKTLRYAFPSLHPLAALAAIPPEDPAVYAALQRADSIGVFQVESRAQMSMLPRLRPKRFYDLVIEVAIVRPGPIQGGMVHPYLARRSGRAPVTCPHPALRPILERTLGVPLFQEQVMQIAIAGAGYTGGEADQLRRDMAAWRKHGRLMKHRQRLLDGFSRAGISKHFGEQLFKQIQGFGEYGFPESHAASFALLVYASTWLKVHLPAAYAASIINSQPMGFYSPSTIVKDAQRHGVEVLPVRVNDSRWDCTATRGAPGKMRLGLRMVKGLGQRAGGTIAQQREMNGPFESLGDLTRRVRLRKDELEALAEAGALDELGTGGRREAMWQARGPQLGPLFEKTTGVQEKTRGLPRIRPVEQLVLDYERVGLSLHDHPMRYLRAGLRRRGAVTSRELMKRPDGQRVTVAGLVLNRQRPYTASGVTFMTLEDETGMVNLVVREEVFEAHRHAARNGHLLLAQGRLERRDGTTHVLAFSIEKLDQGALPAPKSRDFQ